MELNNENIFEAPTEPLNTKTCNICGTKVPETENKCPKCGHEFNIANNPVYQQGMGMNITLTDLEKEKLIGKCKTVGAIYLAFAVFWCWLILSTLRELLVSISDISSTYDIGYVVGYYTVVFLAYGGYVLFCFLKFNKYHNKLPKMLETDNAPFFREMQKRNFAGQIVVSVIFGLIMLLPVIYTNNSLVKEANKILMARGRQSL